MSKIDSLTTITSGYISTVQLNANFDTITAAFANTLSLDGSTPNTMQTDLDLNGFALLNAVIPNFNSGDYSLFEGALGSMSSQNASNVSITGGSITGITYNGTTFTSPKINKINDSNGNTLLNFGVTASAVNNLKISNSATGNPVLVAVEGDTNLGLSISTKGTGTLNLNADTISLGALSATSLATSLLFKEASANGANYVGIKAPATLSVNTVFTLPSADGSAGDYIKTNGSAVLSFVTPPASVFTNSFISTETTVSTSAMTTIPHTLGVVPTFFTIVIRCKTAEQGYSIGDEIPLPFIGYSGGAGGSTGGCSISANSANLYASVDALTVVNKTAPSGVVSLTAGNWKFVGKACA